MQLHTNYIFPYTKANTVQRIGTSSLFLQVMNSYQNIFYPLYEIPPDPIKLNNTIIKKHTTNIVMASFTMNFLSKLLDNNNIFLISIIGPKTMNPIAEANGNVDAKLLAITASEVEHNDRKKAINNYSFLLLKQ